MYLINMCQNIIYHIHKNAHSTIRKMPLETYAPGFDIKAEKDIHSKGDLVEICEDLNKQLDRGVKTRTSSSEKDCWPNSIKCSGVWHL